ncbi:MAG: dual specificity protein phosphatase family protein [Flavobacteriales bacterium]|nr:dual specificity protein phosphatase family protein [Flavobacteriales bacterium]
MKTYVIPRSFPGQLAIVARPRGNDWLETDVIQFKRAGWNVLVSALEPAEERELGLEDESIMAQLHEVKFLSMPIADRGTPGVAKATEFVGELKRLLSSGDNVAVHCRMGIGRSSLLCAATLVAFGEHPDPTWDLLSEVRGLSVPDTDEQRRWLGVFQRAQRE